MNLTNKTNNRTIPLLQLALLAGLGGTAQAAEQVITPVPATLSVQANAAVSFEVNYTTANPVDETLNGLGLRIHFNSAQLAFNSVTNILTTDFIAAGTPVADSANSDGDAATDQFVLVAWASVPVSWPGVGTTPARLYSANFTSTANFTGTQVNFSAAAVAPGYTLAPTSVSVAVFVADTTPDAFSFAPQTNVALNTVVTSNPITVTGINTGSPITITSGSYAINGGAYTSAAGTVNNGDTVTVRQTSSVNPGTATTATLNIGGVTAAFTVTTSAVVGANVPIPTLSEWGLILLVGLMSVGAWKFGFDNG